VEFNLRETQSPTTFRSVRARLLPSRVLWDQVKAGFLGRFFGLSRIAAGEIQAVIRLA